VEQLILLVSDIDNTLLGDDRALAEFAVWWAANKRCLRLAYSSGRFVESVRESVGTTGLPEPDAIIGGVGTQIALHPGDERLADWPPRGGCWEPPAIRAILADCPRIEPQPDQFQSAAKLSYFAYDWDEAALTLLRRRLADARQQVRVVYSSRRDLDVLPAGAGKGAAAGRLARHWRIEPARVIVAGDSGNDLDMFQAGFLGITVGNAHPELKSLRGPNVFHAAQGHAAGVLEGLSHWLTRLGALPACR
jgi:sucrose-6F-phosphate phosphohydrolase